MSCSSDLNFVYWDLTTNPGGCYVVAPSNQINSVFTHFEDFCRRKGLVFSLNHSVVSPDPSTLFTTSGMQKHRSLFSSGHTGTQTDIQHCLRLNDLNEIGDGTHYLDFHMLGLFSFQQMSVQEGVDWWMGFLNELNLSPQVVSIHPDCPEWSTLYEKYDVEIKFDPECKWSDGSIGGYCTEFYRDSIEIGNIVNPLGSCLDCGFGCERIQFLLDQSQGRTPQILTRPQVIDRTIGVLLESGVAPGNQKQGYVLRRLIREQLQGGYSLPDHSFVEQEVVRFHKIQHRKSSLLQKHPDKCPQWFWETHGIPMDE